MLRLPDRTDHACSVHSLLPREAYHNSAINRAYPPLAHNLPLKKQCWCAVDVDLRHGEATCDYPCAGDSEVSCGGFNAFDLFELEGVGTPAPPTEHYYVGCFADKKDDRVLDDMISTSVMTLEVNPPRNPLPRLYGCACIPSHACIPGAGVCLASMRRTNDAPERLTLCIV